jgi:hypothetical protein
MKVTPQKGNAMMAGGVGQKANFGEFIATGSSVSSDWFWLTIWG